MNQHPNHARYQCHILNCNGTEIDNTSKSFNGLGYAHSLSDLSWYAKWLICTICIERQSYRYWMKAYVQKWSGITIKLRETPDINMNTTLLTKCQHNEFKSTSSPNVQSLFSMTENESDGNAEKSKRYSMILVYPMLAVHHSSRII